MRVYTGLGDIAVPGLLACLALRFDASRLADIRARGEAAGLALQGSLDAQVRYCDCRRHTTLCVCQTEEVLQRRPAAADGARRCTGVRNLPYLHSTL